METQTAVDQALELMLSTDESETARLKFFERLVDAELFMMLETESDGESVHPSVFPVEDQNYVLLFDTEASLADFCGQSTPYLSMTGRAVSNLLRGKELGVGVNLNAPHGGTLLPPDALEWLSATLAGAPDPQAMVPSRILPPGNLPETIIAALDHKFASAAGLADRAYLVSVEFGSDKQSQLLGIVGAADGAENALSQGVFEALTFSGFEGQVLDVAFFETDDAISDVLEKHGLRFDFPRIEVSRMQHSVPGMDPENPPKIR